MMKMRKKALLTAAAVTAMFSMGGCGDNYNTGAYGPPPDMDTGRQSSSIADFDPSDNENEDVYGPPPFDEPDSDFAPEDNMVPTVYGPPSDIEPEDKEE